MMTYPNYTSERYFLDNYEEVHAGDSVYRYYYVYTPDGLSAVAEKKNSTMAIYSSETDYLGSIVSLYNYKGQTEFRAEYDAWGRQNVVTDNLAHFQRGYCGHEHWHEFDLIDMNGRMYDPVIARFLSPDPFVQAPEDLQNYNRYSYCLNNPLKYTDPSGEIFWEAVVVGAVIGGIVNVTAAYSKPGVVTNRQTIAYIFAGAAVGAVSTLCGGVGVAGIVPGSFAGAALGGISGAASTATLTVANNLISGNEWNTGVKGALLNGFVGGAIWGAFSGGYAGYNNAKETGSNIWSGRYNYPEKILGETPVTSVRQIGDYDCSFAATESMTGISQKDLLNYYTCEESHGLVEIVSKSGRKDLAKTLDAVSDSKWIIDIDPIFSNPDNLASKLKMGDKVLVTTTVYDEMGNPYGHGLALQSVIEKKFTRCTGKEVTKYLYNVMDPATGRFVKMSSIDFAYRVHH